MKTYVMQVSTGRERQTIELLEHVLGGGSKARFFSPRYRFRRKIKGAWVLTEDLLIPGYVFCAASMLDIDEVVGQLRRVPAFTKVLSVNGSFIPLSQDEESWLKALTGESHVVEPSYGFVEGDRVVITDGPLVGLETQIKKLDRHKRLAYVEVHLLGRTKLVKVGAEIVRKSFG